VEFDAVKSGSIKSLFFRSSFDYRDGSGKEKDEEKLREVGEAER